MKYRIKIITYKNGRKEYRAYFKKWWGWAGIYFKGETCGVTSARDTREEVLKFIDLHFDGNAKIQTIEFEYIQK